MFTIYSPHFCYDWVYNKSKKEKQNQIEDEAITVGLSGGHAQTSSINKPPFPIYLHVVMTHSDDKENALRGDLYGERLGLERASRNFSFSQSTFVGFEETDGR